MGSYGIEVVWDEDDPNNNNDNNGNGGSNAVNNTLLDESLDETVSIPEELQPPSTRPRGANQHRGGKYYSGKGGGRRGEARGGARASGVATKFYGSSSRQPPPPSPSPMPRPTHHHHHNDNNNNSNRSTFPNNDNNNNNKSIIHRAPVEKVTVHHNANEGWATFDEGPFQERPNPFRASAGGAPAGGAAAGGAAAAAAAGANVSNYHQHQRYYDFGGVGVSDSWAENSTIATHQLYGGPSTSSASGNGSGSTPNTSMLMMDGDYDCEGEGWEVEAGNRLNDHKPKEKERKERNGRHGQHGWKGWKGRQERGRSKSRPAADDKGDGEKQEKKKQKQQQQQKKKKPQKRATSSSAARKAERKKKQRRRTILICVGGLFVMGLIWFLVYYFIEGKEKWSIGRNQLAATSSPTVSPAPTISPAPTGSPSVSPTDAPTTSPTSPPTEAPTRTFAPTDGLPSASPTVEQTTSSPTSIPTRAPTPAPTTGSPTLFPTRVPTPAPTTGSPTLSPTGAPTSFDDIRDPAFVVEMAAAELRRIIEDDPLMGPKFVRLGFHDCVGFCDGCVDMTFHDNFGLEVPIEALDPVVRSFERPDLGFSRADIWALSALVAADFHQEQNEEFLETDRVNFQMQFIGRQNCEDRHNGQCFDEDGTTMRECSATLGPFHHLPMADITTHSLFAFFDEEFGFNDQEVVALMGAHTLGGLARENSGIDGPNGWVLDNQLLNNEYYFELVGGENMTSPIEEWIDLAPPWLRVIEDNSDLPDFENKAVWEAFPPSTVIENEVERLIMLNADIAIVRELTEDNMDEFGRVSCTFIESVGGAATPRCPHAQRSLEFAAQYRFDNELWLRDFRDVYHKMLNHGCTDATFCNGGLCECTLR